MIGRLTVRAEGAATLFSISLCLVMCGAIQGCAESAGSPEVLVERGHLLESRGRFREAIDAYTNALAVRPNVATIYYDRGVAFGRLAEWKEAIADYTRAIEHDPGLARAYNNRAAAYAQERRFEAAAADFTKAISLDPRAALTYRNRGLAYHDLGRLNQAIDDFTVAVTLEPEDSEGPFVRGNAYLDAKEYQKALADFSRAIELNPTRAGAWLNRGEAYRRLGDSKHAAADTQKAKQLDPHIVATAAAQSPPPSKPQGSPSEISIAADDSIARRKQALQVAAVFLQSKGFRIEPAPASAPFILACTKATHRLRVEVQMAAEGQPALRITREQIEAAERADRPTALVVVEQLAPPPAAGLPYTGGKVVKFEENWKPDRQKLVPLVFEYPLR